MKYKVFSRSELNSDAVNCVDIRLINEEKFCITLFCRERAKGIQSFTEKSSITISCKEVVSHATQLGLFVDGNSQFTKPINLTTLSNTRDGYATLNLLSIGDKNPAVIFYSRDDENCVIITDFPVSTDLELKENVAGYPYEIYKMVFGDSYNTKFKAWEAKRELLFHADPNQCLAYMEAQLDLLTSLVFLMVPLLPPEGQAALNKSFPEMNAFKDVYAKSSVLQVKKVKACLDEMQKTKANLRELQVNYYNLKQG